MAQAEIELTPDQVVLFAPGGFVVVRDLLSVARVAGDRSRFEPVFGACRPEVCRRL